MSNIQLMGCPNPTLRMGKSKAGPVVTDNGNFIIDAPFDEVYMRDPTKLSYQFKIMTGLLEDGTVIIQSKNGKTQKMSVEEGKAKTQSNGHQPQSSFKA
ncbi:hypothetical protein MJO29_007988 [Puccinia striiformis f. sp. tritici]|uniref:Ribose 5-phosphate isomerase A n=1 Tax=Puccinia striiformis f. sp. tritici PST-78 TaxID=1165861 RepID=A0A0L0V6H9_9BASI|nr:hypothetical protein MJO29_007988 [Puccinia striiformis f. sp. tritici]KNE94887.1 ribose 5-phosphate isomerase A [Puccinia striiformis f. sp. tritici PST-78]